MGDVLTIDINEQLLMNKNHMSGVILESDGLFNRRTKTYPIPSFWLFMAAKC